jgi:hypothetical protein
LHRIPGPGSDDDGDGGDDGDDGARGREGGEGEKWAQKIRKGFILSKFIKFLLISFHSEIG